MKYQPKKNLTLRNAKSAVEMRPRPISTIAQNKYLTKIENARITLIIKQLPLLLHNRLIIKALADQQKISIFILTILRGNDALYP